MGRIARWGVCSGRWFMISCGSWDLHRNTSLCRDWPRGGSEGWNQACYNNPDFDELLDKMNAESDLKKRREFLFEMQRIMAEDLPYGVFLRPDLINPVRTDRFEGYVETMGGVSTWINPWTYFSIHQK